MLKFKSFNEILKIVAKLRKSNKGHIVVTTNGCFDVLHVGHIRNLLAAKKLGDTLIVGLNSDSSVKKSKGPERPIIPEKERAEILASLETVDYVFIFSGRTPFSWIKKIKPNIHVKGGGEDILNHPDFPMQKKIIENAGGKFILLPHVNGKSTTAIIQKIKSL